MPGGVNGGGSPQPGGQTGPGVSRPSEAPSTDSSLSAPGGQPSQSSSAPPVDRPTEAQATPVQITGTIGQKMGEETVWGRGALAVGMPEGARWAELTYTRSEGGETVTVAARGEAYEGNTF